MHRRTIEVWRWACELCRHTFRHLPPFIEPFKRYATFAISEFAARVLDSPCSPYRKATEKSRNDSRKSSHFWTGGAQGLSHSTVWRWITWMAKITIHCLETQPEAGTAESILLSEKAAFTFPLQRYQSAERLNQLHWAKWLMKHQKLGREALPRKRNRVF